MILIKADSQEFQYDIHSLVKAFYPEEDVVYHVPERHDAISDPVRVMEVTVPDPAPDRRRAKDLLKQELYLRLREETGHDLPWGSLTGIRPTRIPLGMLYAGKTAEEITAHMSSVYFCSEEKTALAIEIAEREKRLLEEGHYEDGYSLYIGIPFCPTTCLYCSFASYPVKAYESQVNSYLAALGREIADTARIFKNRTLHTVYIGGGTPTALSASQLDALIRKIKNEFDLKAVREFTVEAGRPDSITPEKLSVLKEHRISRISVNPQTFSQKTLDLIGRHHTTEQTIESFRLARQMGFENINMDLIIGLPGENIEDIRHTMEVIGELRPDDVTVHSLAVKRGSRLKLEMEEFRRFQMINTTAQMRLAEDKCRSMGLSPYYLYRQKNMAGNFENVGYASPGHEGLYNMLMMEEIHDIAACGAGTVSKRIFPDGRIERVDTVKELSLYIERIDEMMGRKRALFG